MQWNRKRMPICKDICTFNCTECNTQNISITVVAVYSVLAVYSILAVCAIFSIYNGCFRTVGEGDDISVLDIVY